MTEKNYYNSAVLNYPPKWLTVTITNICNNNCVFCAYHCSDAKKASNVYNIPFKLSFNDFKKIVDMAYKGGIPHVHICSTGEPFMNKDIIQMIDYVIKIYGKASVQTNFYKPLFDKFNYFNEIIKRKKYISYITTDILSGEPSQHNELKKGSNYEEVMSALKYITANSNITIIINYIITKLNYKTITKLISDISFRGIKNCGINITNLFAYDFNKYTSPDLIYTSSDTEITEALKAADKYARKKNIKISIPLPTDKSGKCDVFWQKIQIWPVNGNDPARYHENLIPHACRAVVKGKLSSLGYIFDYDNVMDFWNNEKIVAIRRNLIEDVYPDSECRYCFYYKKELPTEVKNTKKQWRLSADVNLEKFKNSRMVAELNEKSVCIDCGANIGVISEVLAEKGAEVYAFEPNPYAYAELKKRFQKNKKVRCINKAVLDRNTKMKLYMHRYNNDDNLFWSQGSSVFKSKDDINKEEYVEVEVIDIIKFIKDLNRTVHILKLDIEGGEYDVLLKLIKEDVYKKIKYILVETHEKRIFEIRKKEIIVKNLIKTKNIKNINLNWV